MAKISPRKIRRWWFLSRGALVSVPLVQVFVHALDHDWIAAFTWLAMTIVIINMILIERNAFHHGYHFGQIVILWCMKRGVPPSEFAKMPEPQVWDIAVRTMKVDDDLG